jgi:hypothetical protein
MRMTATRFRQDLFKTLDRIALTGEPLEIERKGAVLRLQLAESAGHLLDLERFASRRHLLHVPAQELVSSDWSALWRPEGGFEPGAGLEEPGTPARRTPAKPVARPAPKKRVPR